MAKETEFQAQKPQRVPNKMNLKEPTPRHIIIKVLKVKDKEGVLKVGREKLVTYKGMPIKLSADFSTENLQARREWHDIFNTIKGKTENKRQSCQQGCHSESKGRERVSKTNKS